MQRPILPLSPSGCQFHWYDPILLGPFMLYTVIEPVFPTASTFCTPCASGWTTLGEGSTMCSVYSECDNVTKTVYINTTVEVEKIVEVRRSYCISP